MRAALLGALVATVGLAGCVELPFGGQSQESIDHDAYVLEVQVAVSTMSMVFAQADETVKAFEQGWIAPEGAASEFQLLTSQVKQVRADISGAQPPQRMDLFHRQLGRSVSLTGQAMDAMHAGFTSGDSSFFELAHEKLSEARQTMNRAVDTL